MSKRAGRLTRVVPALTHHVEKLRQLLGSGKSRHHPDEAQIARKVRLFASHRFIRGAGLEIGALHEPLPLFHGASVRYVDALTDDELRRAYPEVANQPCVHVDIVADAETLAPIVDASVDFVIANHVLEHCRDPIRALQNMLRVIRPGGVLFLAIPDKRYTFDEHRAVTPYEHLVRDYSDGAAVSDRQHYEEWRRDVLRVPAADSLSLDELRAAHPDIHFHAWTQREIAELLLNVPRDFAMRFEIELLATNGAEVVAVLRKRKDGPTDSTRT